MAQESLLEVFQRPTWNHTVLAPIDAAWQAVPESTIESLVKNDDLAIEFFDAHLVEDLIGSESLADCSLRTMAGSVPVIAAGGKIMVGEATVLEADILASNGIVHAVDALIEGAPASS